MARQGDILIIEAQSIPKGATAREAKRIVLAEGEVTGHNHTVVCEAATIYELPVSEQADRWLRLQSPGQLVHQEHGAIEIPAGDYIVRRQREYSPQEIRRVAD